MRGVTTQQPSRALVREAAGLCLTAFGVLGVLLALGALHWAAGLSAAMAGLIVLGLPVVPMGGASRSAHVARWAAIAVGYSGLTATAFVLCRPLGGIAVALAAVVAGLWLATDRESEGA